MSRARSNVWCKPWALVLALAAPISGLQLEPRRLAPGDVVDTEVRGGASHSYLIALRAMQYVQVVVDQKGIDLEEVLSAPDGRVVAHADLPNGDYGPETVVAIANSAGDYRLTVHSTNPAAPPGRYTLRVEAIRESTSQDQKHVEAERLVDDAITVSARRTAAGMADAIEKNSRALSYFESAGDPYRQALTLNHVGLLRASSGDFRSALDAYERARKLFGAAGDRHGEANALNNAGAAYNTLGDLDKAMEDFRQALTLHRAAGETGEESQALNNMASLYLDMADWQRATEIYRQALALARTVGDRRMQSSMLHNLGVASLRRNVEGAIDYYQQALAIRRETGDRRGQAQTLAELGSAYGRLGQWNRTLAYEEQALTLQQALGNRGGEARALRTLGVAHTQLGDPNRGLSLLAEAIAKARAVEDRRGESLALVASGQAYSQAAKPRDALESYRKAAALSEQIGDSNTMADSFEGMARAQRDLGNLEEARRNAERALQYVEKVRANAGGDQERAAYLSTAHDSYELYIDLLMSLREPAAALEASERSRARSMLDMLSESGADIREGVNPEMLQRERDLSNLVNAKGARLLPLVGRSDARVAELQKEIRDLERAYQDLQADIRKTSPRYAALTQPQTLTLKQIQEQVLDADSLLLEYSLGENRSFLWAIGKNSFSSWELPPRDKIEAQAETVYKLLTARGAGLAAASRQLSDMILAPAAAILGNQRLVIVPDGGLQRLPFAALPKPGSAEPLVVHHEIVMLPSASAISVLRTEISGRKSAPKMLAVFADPVFGLDDPRAGGAAAYVPPPESSRILEHLAEPAASGSARLRIARLPYTAQEADQILSVARSPSNLKAVGFQASRALAISGRLSDYRYLHFATHGYLDTERPSLSALVLSQVDAKGQPLDGFLRVNDIYNARLSADLVVLSACQTGLGKEVRGEGLMGLTRAFLYAGAPRVVVSLWNVNDRATADLMAALYRSMLRDGKRPSAALREAQLELRKHKQWESPYYWAAFVEHGEWR